MKILIVDDSLLDRKIVSKMLASAGVKNEILQAENGEVALSVIADNVGQIALLLLDYQMPKISGLELMEALVKVPVTASIPIVMATASSSEESKQAAYAVNPKLAGYIIKPFNSVQLMEAIKPFVQL